MQTNLWEVKYKRARASIWNAEHLCCIPFDISKIIYVFGICFRLLCVPVSVCVNAIFSVYANKKVWKPHILMGMFNVCRCVSWSITPSFDYIHTDFVWWICLFATFMFQSSELMIFMCAFLCLRCGQNSRRTYSTKGSNRQNNNKMIIKTDFFGYKRGESLH